MENLVLFHTGRGGRFNNAGHKVCKGLVSQFNPEYYGINIYYDEDAENPDVTLDNEEVVCTLDEMRASTGVFDIDGGYDTYNWLPIAELDEKELKIMIRDLSFYEYEDALIDSGVDADVLKLLEVTGNLLEYVETIHNQVSFEKFKGFKEVLVFDNEDDCVGNYNLVEIDDKFYTIS